MDHGACTLCWSAMAGAERRGGTRLVAGPDDEALFREVLKDVEPLKKRAARITPEIYHSTTPMPDRPPVTSRPRPHPSQPPGPARAAGPARPLASARPTKLQPLHLGAAVGTDRRTAERLRRGRMAVEARLDLHGLTQDQAHRQLLSFIRRAAAAGTRCVLVVTGKGSVSQGGGVLRRRLPDWLAQGDCRPLVLAVTRARRAHGGDGAFYVLLRRQRDHHHG